MRLKLGSTPAMTFVARDNMWATLAAWRRRRDKAVAFAGDIIFGTPMPDIAADPFLAQPVSIECRCS
jgi:hypothetical protein